MVAGACAPAVGSEPRGSGREAAIPAFTMAHAACSVGQRQHLGRLQLAQAAATSALDGAVERPRDEPWHRSKARAQAVAGG